MNGVYIDTRTIEVIGERLVRLIVKVAGRDCEPHEGNAPIETGIDFLDCFGDDDGFACTRGSEETIDAFLLGIGREVFNAIIDD